MVYLILAFLGLSFGSFAMALVWRIQEERDFVTDRSECEYCGHKLEVIDLIPVFSWLLLRGRCRYCNEKINWQYPLAEILLALLFVGSYVFWPAHLASWQAWASFSIWLIYVVALFALFVYDLRWMILPDVLVLPLIALALVDVVLRFSVMHGVTVLDLAEHVIFGALALGGFYWLLYKVSNGKWVGFGDVKLGLFMGIVLGWQQALAVLFLANVIGFLFVVPGMIVGKLNRKSRVPFGPFLIIAFIVVGLFGQRIIDSYLSMVLLR